MDQNKKAKLGWVLFDWANSSYSLVISTAVFPVFFLENSRSVINIAGLELSNASVYAYSVSLAYLIISFLSPVLSGIADYGGYRKNFMRFFTTCGSIACVSLFFFDGHEHLWIGILGFLIATASHAGSLVFYDSYLSGLVPVSERDSLSARGYAFGYIGSVILLCFNLWMISNPETLGFDNAKSAARWSFVCVGIWWLGFAQFSFAWLPGDLKNGEHKLDLTLGLRELKKAWNYLRYEINCKRYLIAYFFYSAGVQTVIYLASAFAKEVLKFDSASLILIILILQLVAIGGAYFFALMSHRFGNLPMLQIMICIWILICFIAYFITSQSQFYFLAALVGMVLGGIQALSRSTYSKLLPANHPDITCFYSFYNVIYYFSIVFGTFLFGFINQFTGSMRGSVLALMVLFVCGLYFLRKGIVIREPNDE